MARLFAGSSSSALYTSMPIVVCCRREALPGACTPCSAASAAAMPFDRACMLPEGVARWHCLALLDSCCTLSCFGALLPVIAALASAGSTNRHVSAGCSSVVAAGASCRALAEFKCSSASALGACAAAAVEGGLCSSTVQAGCRRSRLCTKAIAIMAPAGAECHMCLALKPQNRDLVSACAPRSCKPSYKTANAVIVGCA